MLSDYRLDWDTPRSVALLHFDVWFYGGPAEEAAAFREAFWHFQNEGATNWKFRVFESEARFASVSASAKLPDVLVTHWHGEYRSNRNVPREIVERIRAQRRDLTDGPFLAAKFSRGDDRFVGTDLVNDLLTVHDMVFEQPQTLESIISNVAIGLFNSVARERGAPASVTFENGFRAALPAAAE